jgi:hypothetical protein
MYLKPGLLTSRSWPWLRVAGHRTFDSLLDAADFVRMIEKARELRSLHRRRSPTGTAGSAGGSAPGVQHAREIPLRRALKAVADGKVK